MSLNVAVVFGSRSCEHDVSIISGLLAVNALDTQKYRAIPVYISRAGDWYVGNALRDIAFYRAFDPRRLKRVLPVGRNRRLDLMEHPEDKALFGRLRVIESADIAIPVLHGMNGEDGTIQGMLELWDVPYTSTGMVGSAVGMDKIVMKAVFRGMGFPVLAGAGLDRADWEQDRERELDRLEGEITYPMYVKPANLGSSIGISRADGREMLADGIDIAAEYDRRIIVEKGVVKIKEVNCSVLGFGNDVSASVLEMPIRWDDKDILDFASKYLSGGGKGMESQGRRIPAPISAELTEKIRALSIEVFKSLDCKGVVRIDYIIDESDNSYYICEINTIPGSLSFYLWSENDLTFSELLTKMINFAMTAHREKLRNKLSFESTILENAGKGIKGKKHGV